MTNKAKNILFMVVIVGIISLLYIFYIKEDNGTVKSVKLEQSSPSTVVAGGEFLATLSRVSKLDIDVLFFTENLLFQKLKDFGAEIKEYSIKRDNPFAPIGVDIIEATKDYTAGVATTTKKIK